MSGEMPSAPDLRRLGMVEQLHRDVMLSDGGSIVLIPPLGAFLRPLGHRSALS